MTRDEEIKQAAEQYAWVGDLYDMQAAFTAGAKWADANPTHCSVRMVDSQSYSKQQLREMGFAFDLNGNVLSPNYLATKAAHYVIDKACEWLQQHQESYDMYDAWSGDFVNFKSLIIDFRKAMEEYSIETIKISDCNPKAQPCVLTNHGIDTNVVKFD